MKRGLVRKFWIGATLLIIVLTAFAAGRAMSAFQLPVHPMATTMPPVGSWTLKKGKACDDERPPCGCIECSSPTASSRVRA